MILRLLWLRDRVFSVYLVISLVALVVDYGAYIGFSISGLLPLEYAAATAYSLGLLVSFFGVKKSIFSNGWLSDKVLSEFLLFCASGVVGILLTFLIVRFVSQLENVDSIHLPKVVAVGVSFLVVYGLRRALVFKLKPN